MSKENAAFVLVHGAWHGHHTWDALVPELEAAGHSVVAFDLPGACANGPPAETIQGPSPAVRHRP